MRIKKKIRNSVNIISKKLFTNKILNFFNINTVFLNYHRVINNYDFINFLRPNDDLIVTTKIFEEQIKYLSENFNVISINDIHLKNIKDRKIVLTFDDGYLDNYINALPILEKYNCPAILYIATSYLDNIEYPWWSKVWEILRNTKNIRVDGKKFEIDKNEEKIKLYGYLCKILISQKKKIQHEYIKNIISENNISLSFHKKEFLTTENLKSLGNHKLIEIGCHTHNHENLKNLNENEINYEISKSLNILEKILSKKVRHFSIPYGVKKTFTRETINLISKYNFQTIVTTEHGIFNKKNCNQIPRIGIGNLDVKDRLNSKAIGLDSLINKILRR